MTLENGTAGFNSPPPEAVNNGTGQLAPEPSAATGFEPVSPQESSEQQPSIESLQTRIVELEESATKRENDYRSLEGRYKGQQGDDAKFDQLSENVMTLTDTLAALLKHQGTQDEEMFNEDLQKIETNAQTRKSTSTFQRTSQLMIDEISQTVKEAGLDLASAPELEEFRELWGPA